uniref:ATP synthase subunit alpha n=1 Tax=Rhizaria sp. TaxID=2204297 RepID=A0A5P8DJU6_9EUKA|nr:ATP synthase subunit alpha [Rhizaria sp.]
MISITDGVRTRSLINII